MSRYALSESTAAPRKIVTQPQIQLVLTAIEDEIYTHNLEKAYVDLGPDKISIYVKPHFENGMIWVIYKLLPFGELMRGAVINEGRGVAILSGDPDVGFPPTNGSAMPTLYLDDDAVIKMKTSWKRVSLPIAINPSAPEIDEAKRRQEERFILKHQ